MNKKDNKVFTGLGLSPGVAVGTAYRVESQVPTFYRISITPQEVEPELRRFNRALKQSRRQLGRAKQKFEAEVGQEHSYIIDAHLLILEDRQLLEQVEQKIAKDLQSPERAIREVAEGWLSAYRALNDPFFQERGSDLEEVVDRVVANLMELDSRNPLEFPQDLILVAPEMSLFFLAELPLEQIKGLVLGRAGNTSHVVIVARSYHIPVVSGLKDLGTPVRTGDMLIIDGTSGTVRVRPSETEIRNYRIKADEEKKRQMRFVADPDPCATSDGRRVHLYANAEIENEVPVGIRLGAEGIGLFRSEYLFMRHREGPMNEEGQFEIYKELAQTVGDRPAMIRTLDIASEQHPYFSAMLGETREGALGLRGIRMSLQFTEIFKTQIRALLRASLCGNLKILLPMISSLEEVMESRRMIEEAKQELTGKGIAVNQEIEVGIMLEVPAAVIMLESLAPHVNFFAVGTNDLVQYTMAVGRRDDRMAHLANPLQPAVLQTVRRVASVASGHGVRALVCGEVAANPMYAALLVGMGFQHLSMNVFSIPEVKERLRRLSYYEARKTVEHALRLSTLEDVQRCVNERLNIHSGVTV